MSNLENHKEEKINWWQIGLAVLGVWAIHDNLRAQEEEQARREAYRQMQEQSNVRRIIESIERISRWHKPYY